MTITKIMVPPGKYYVGDPCYVFVKSDWQKILSSNKPNDLIINVEEGEKIIMFGVGGDGYFVDTSGKKYSVDSGSLGLVPIDLIDRNLIDGNLTKGNLFTFASTTLCKYIEDEFIAFGDVVFNLNSEVDFEYERNVEGRDCWQIWE